MGSTPDLPQVYFQKAHGKHRVQREIFLEAKKWGGEIDLLGSYSHEY